MLRRLLMGLVEGLLIGLAVGVGAARGLGLNATSSVSALLLGAAAGFLVGLVAGRPVWARNAKTEALLKAVVGTVGGAGLALAAGHWLVAPLSMAALPLAATVLALFFELDDNGAGRDKRRIAGARAKQRFGSAASSPELAELDEASDEPEHKLGKR